MTNAEAQIVIGNIPLKPEVLDDCYSITEYQEAKAMAIEALEHTRWIPVSERLPEEGEYLVVFRLGGLIYCREICYFDGNTWHKGGYDEVVKWQYLPDIEEGERK